MAQPKNKTSKLPRGLNNNNPGNIEKNKQGKLIWQGEIDSTDSRFAQFVDIKYGYRAMFKLLASYETKYKKKTIKDMIYTWAPPTTTDGKFENHTDIYVNSVAKEAGVKPEQIISTKNKDVMVKMVAAMSKVENGIAANMTEVLEGWDLYIKN